MKAVLPSPHDERQRADARTRPMQCASERREHGPCAEEHEPHRRVRNQNCQSNCSVGMRCRTSAESATLMHPPVQALRQRRRRIGDARDEHAENQAGDQQQQSGHRAASLAMHMSKVRAAFDLA